MTLFVLVFQVVYLKLCTQLKQSENKMFVFVYENQDK